MNKRITPSQLIQFKEEGFVKISNCLSALLLLKLRNLIDEVIADEKDTLKVTLQIEDKKFVTNIQSLGNKNNLTCLELLASPFLLEVAQTICGEDFFCLQEFAVIKNLGDNLPALWHQDIMHQRTGDCFMVGVYLDDTNANDGALKIIPQSHLSDKKICDIVKEDTIEIPMQAGDILVHDMMLAHSSEPLQVNQKRRVIYFEFLSATQVEKEGIYSKELATNRTNLLNVALSYHQLQNPLLEQYYWKRANLQNYKTIEEMRAALDAIYAIPIQGKPSNYCFEL